MLGRWLVSAACVLALGCAGSNRDRAWVTNELSDRGFTSSGGDDALDRLAGGVDEDDAVAIALASSPTYAADLARIDSARADLDEAGRPANPQITLLGALGPVSMLATLLAPLESLWQIPLRTDASARALEGVAESLVQSGLDLARDARLAHVERGLAEERVRIRAALAETAIELSRIASARARLGETSPAEAATVHAEASAAINAHQESEAQLLAARARLRTVLGLDGGVPPFDIVFARTPAEPPTIEALIGIARASRPDVRAAELAVHAAAARAGWERSRVVAIAAQIEGHWTRSEGADELAMRMGARIELPIFGANPGGIGRAEAEIARATAALEIARQRVVLEIVEAHTRMAQAQRSLALQRAEVLPALEEALRVAQMSYEVGEETFVVVLDVLRRIGEARLREADLVAEARRADAELERAVGARIGAGGSRSRR